MGFASMVSGGLALAAVALMGVAVAAPPVAIAAPFLVMIDPTIVKIPRPYRDVADGLHAVAVVRDDKGADSEFVEDEVVVRDDPAEVAALVAKYHARVLRQITVNLISTDGATLPPVKTTPRTVLVLDASAAPLRIETEAPALRASGLHRFSSAKGSNLAAIVAHERAAGHAVQLYFLGRGAAFPTSSKEKADQNGQDDAYQWPEFDHRTWQYVAALGVKNHPLVAVIDGGFWLNSQGIPCGYALDSLCQQSGKPAGASDLPRFMIEGDATGGPGPAGGTNPASCTGGSSCPWHGNRSASILFGALDNHAGAAGTGAPLAVPMLIKTDASSSEGVAAMEAAVGAHAAIISISSGGGCNWWCRTGENATGTDMDEPSDAMDQGVLVVAAAGNDSQDAGGEDFWPCIFSFCVGAMNPFPDGNGYFTKMDGFGVSYSNYGSSVAIWAPTNIHAMGDVSSGGALVSDNGTSAATPYVAGVAALMKAINPGLSGRQLAAILHDTGTQTVSSAYPDDQSQTGTLIQPLAALLAASNGKAVAPQVRITSPGKDAKVGSTLYQPVDFTAAAEDVLDGAWPHGGAKAIRWKSSIDGDMEGQNVGVSQGTALAYGFSPVAKPGKRTITATVTNAHGMSASDSIVVDYEPQIADPGVSIVYPAAGATFPAGKLIVRGQARSALSLGYVPCDKMVWQEGIAPSAIASTDAGNGLCQAQVTFQASSSPRTLKLTATDETGKVASATESLNITAPSSDTVVSIDSPAPNAGYVNYPVYGTPVKIGLHAFASNAPPGGGLVYTWSWYDPSAPSAKTTIGTGASQTFSRMCGTSVVMVTLSAPSIPVAQQPTAKEQVEISCESSQ